MPDWLNKILVGLGIAAGTAGVGTIIKHEVNLAAINANVLDAREDIREMKLDQKDILRLLQGLKKD